MKNDVVKYDEEIKQAKKEYEELQGFYKDRKFSDQNSDDDRYLFNISKELFDGYYKSLTFTVYNVNEMCELSKNVDIYDKDEIMIIEGIQWVI